MKYKKAVNIIAMLALSAFITGCEKQQSISEISMEMGQIGLPETVNTSKDEVADIVSESYTEDVEMPDNLIQSANIETIDDLESWIGQYTFEEVYSEEGYAPMSMMFNITIYKEEGRYYADVVQNGQLIGADVKARAYGDEEWISLVLMEYNPGHFNGLAKSENNVILSMRRQGEEIYTYWGITKPLFEDHYMSGNIYLKRTTEATGDTQDNRGEIDSIDNWVGKYSFSEGFSESGGDLMFYNITVYEEEGQYFADLVIIGHNDTNIDVKTKVYGDNEWISLVLVGYNPDHVAGLEGMENMVLLSLRKQGEEIYTYWGDREITDLLLKKRPMAYYETNNFFEKEQ